MKEAVIITGSGRYADPWHRFPDTSRSLASILEKAGYTAMIREDVDDTLAGWATAEHSTDLLVFNVGLPRDGRPSPAREGAAAIRSILHSPLPVLAMHSSSTSFADSPEWEALIGGRWIRGTSMHPPRGNAHVELADQRHPITVGCEDFTVDDERYSYLRRSANSRVLATHEHAGEQHPLIWAFDRPSGARTVYDGLGHCPASYQSPGHVRLLLAAVQWLSRGSD